MAHKENKNVIYTIGFFNDLFRDTIKGETFDSEGKGYATGNTSNVTLVKELLLGSAFNRFKFKYSSQSINYVECHDNLTFYDKARLLNPEIALVKKQQKLATAMVILSQGVPFLHSGQEFYGSKNGVTNSFDSGDDINHIHWNLLDENYQDVKFLSSLIALRKKHPCFCLKASSDLAEGADVIILGSKALMVHLSNGSDFLIIFKPTQKPETILIPQEYVLYLASTELIVTHSSSEYELRDIGTYVFTKKRMNDNEL
jgi:pullulanase